MNQLCFVTANAGFHQNSISYLPQLQAKAHPARPLSACTQDLVASWAFSWNPATPYWSAQEKKQNQTVWEHYLWNVCVKTSAFSLQLAAKWVKKKVKKKIQLLTTIYQTLWNSKHCISAGLKQQTTRSNADIARDPLFETPRNIKIGDHRATRRNRTHKEKETSLWGKVCTSVFYTHIYIHIHTHRCVHCTVYIYIHIHKNTLK